MLSIIVTFEAIFIIYNEAIANDVIVWHLFAPHSKHITLISFNRSYVHITMQEMNIPLWLQ